MALGALQPAKTGQIDDFGRGPAGNPVFGHNRCFYASADIEKRSKPHKSWLGGARQVIQNAVGYRFVEGTGISERPYVKL